MKTLSIILATTLASSSDMFTYVSEGYPSQSTSTQKIKEKIDFEKLYKQLGSDSFRERRYATYILKKRVNEINIEDICKLYGNDSLEVRIRAKNIALHLMENKKDFDVTQLVELYEHEDTEVSSNAEKLFHDSINCPGIYPQLLCLPSFVAGIKNNNEKYKYFHKREFKYISKANLLDPTKEIPTDVADTPCRKIATYYLVKDLIESKEYNLQEVIEVLKFGWQGEKIWRDSLGKEVLKELEEYSTMPTKLIKE